jgi:predicted TPR repeat methyltransferase
MLKTGRNAPCPCGSGKKYKQCCLSEVSAVQSIRDATEKSKLLKIGITNHQAGNLREAETVYRQALLLDTNDCNVLHLLGLLAIQKNKPEQAIEFLGRVISINPSLYSAHFSLGNVYQSQGKFGEAITCFHQAISRKPDYAEAYNNLGVACKELGRLDNALSYYLEAISLSPDFVEALSNLGNLYKEMDRSQEAIECLLKAIKINPKYSEGYYNLGLILKESGKIEDARACFKESIRLNPGFSDAHNNLGNIFMSENNLDEAQICFQKAIALKPECVETLINMGVVLRFQGRTNDALHYFVRVLKIDSENAIAIHFMDVLNGKNPEHPPARYIEKIFDAHADTFEHHLVEELDYRTPEKLIAIIKGYSEPSSQKWDVLDLGCGTGLVGTGIASDTRHLVGVDLSANMLKKAKARNLYQRLEKAELLDMMRGEEASSYDLIIAADVFVYLGKLDQVFQEAMRLLRTGGNFAFSVKAIEAMSHEETNSYVQKDYQLNDTGRYAHSATYLNRLAAEIGFVCYKMVQTQARLEHGESVQAWLVLWRKA